MTRKKDGFNGQSAMVLPKIIQTELQSNPLTKLLYPTDIGYYPQAMYHFRERPEGCLQHILIYCTDGSGWIETSGSYKKVEKNQYFIIPASIPHRYGASKSNPWSIRWLHFSGSGSGVFTTSGSIVKDLDSDENSRYAERIQLFDEIFRNLSQGSGKENLEYSCICLWHLLGSFIYSEQFRRIKEVQKQNLVEKGIVYMNEHMNEQISLEDLASYCGRSVSHFSMIFKKKTSIPPIEYFLGLKMQKACQMLDFTDMQVKEIAIELAFEDQFYFSRLFRKMIGVSPVEYRKKKKG